MKPVSQWGTNWSGSQARAQAAYSAGVQAYSGDWAGATVAQQGAMLQNLTQAVTSGRWSQGVQRRGTQGWKAATEAKQANYSTGFSAGANAYNASAQKIGSALQSIVPSLPPRGTFEQNKLRSTSLMDQLHALKGQLGA